MKTIKLKSGEMEIPSKVGEWELFSGMSGSSKAAQALTGAVSKGIRFIQKTLTERSGGPLAPSDEEIRKALTDAYEIVSEVMSKHCNVGARDSEPRFVASNTLLRGASFVVYGNVGELRNRGWDTWSF